MTISQPTRNVHTELNYWKHVEGSAVVFDFGKPGAEAEYDKHSSTGSKAYDITINDVRGKEKDFSLAKNGFQYVSDPVPQLSDCKSEDEIADFLLPVTKDLAKQQLGATRVDILASRIRSKDSTDTAKRQNYRGPAHSVHSDFTPAGALKQLENVIQNVEEREQLLKDNRVYVINVWRPLKTITRDPLAVCDWQSVDWKRDWITTRFVFPHGWSELGSPMYHEEHKWYWLSEQKPSEALVFVQFDSDKFEEGSMTTAHSAFIDQDFNDGPPRESMEIKMFAFVPKA